MEGHAQTVEDNLVDSLSFKLRPGASYVTNRRSVTFWPSTGGEYGPSAIKTIKIALNGDQWLDPRTVKLFFTLYNNSTGDIKPIAPHGWVFFRRLRVICGGQILEDIDNYARVHQMFHIMEPGEKRLNDAIEGFGIDTGTNLTIDFSKLNNPDKIVAGDKRVICFSPFCGILRQEKYLPIRYCPLQFEFELYSSTAITLSNPAPAVATKYLLTDVQIKCDLLDLDNGFDNQYSQFLLSGKMLPIHYTAVSHSSQVLTNYRSDVHVSRSLTRLKAVFISLLGLDISTPDPGISEVNFFYHPMNPTAADTKYYDYNEELEFQIQVGSKLFPEMGIRSLAEAYYQLRKTLGLHFGTDSMNFNPRYYLSSSFVTAIDMEKVLGASFTGQNTKGGDLLTIRMKPANVNNMAITKETLSLHYTLVFDSMIEIGLAGVNVLD